jgi:hypothetical protein
MPVAMSKMQEIPRVAFRGSREARIGAVTSPAFSTEG